MNFSEYTLLCVGDSFTFGQGTIEHFNVTHGIGATYEDNLRQEWKRECNSNSYAFHVGENFGFKQVINLGVPGGTNELSLINADTWISQNKQEKVFLLFSLTDPQRQIYFNKSHLDTFKSSDNKNLQYYYTVLNNDISLTFKHFHFRRRLKNFIDAHNLKHYVFSAFDSMDSRITKRRKSWEMVISEGLDHWNKLNISTEFINWMNDIENENTFGNNYLSINKLLSVKKDFFGTDIQEKTVFEWLEKTCNQNYMKIYSHAEQHHKTHKSLSFYDTHYSKHAHKILAQLISAQIQQNIA